ncbi:MAG: GAF domain-containing protein [Acidobacteria bacterium]|nr:GAF domain-containing protein [Acidobacteriota bacterium]MCA1611934.1 GAF domain-containing protein [Acidobacteriota bacterium]
MPPGQPSGFRRVVFHGRPVAELLFHMPDEKLEPRRFSVEWCLGENEVAVVLYDASLARALDGPPPASVGTAADRVGVLLVGERPGDIDPFWSARLYFSLPEGASSEHLARAVRSLFRVLEDRTRSARARRELSNRTSEIRSLVDVGIALSAESDHEQLLEQILSSARALTAADAGSLYLVEDESPSRSLKIVRAQNDSVRFRFVERAVPLDRASIAGFVAETGQALNLSDVGAIPPGAPYHFDAAFDRQHGYRSRSMLTVPMTTPSGRTIGVLQLLNRIRRTIPEGAGTAVIHMEVVAFDADNEEIAKSLAAQAAVAVENRRLSESIRRLFEGFVEASVTAIEQRDPTTSGHSERVALLACGLAQRVDASTDGPYAGVRISREELRELRYAAVLHDFGKVGVREQILVKARKLPAGIAALIRSRIDQAILSAAAEVWESAARGRWTDGKVAEVLAGRIAILEKAWGLVASADEPTLLSSDVSAEVLGLSEVRYRDPSGTLRPVLEPEELHYLSIPKGNLTAAERVEIESHVTSTFRFLSRIPWTPDLSRVPEWAYAHHEKLDGSGYPRRLEGAGIPLPVRAITISDIYDALAARDRPYKSAVPDDRALDILRGEAKRGAIDSALLELFIESKVYVSALSAKGPR